MSRTYTAINHVSETVLIYINSLNPHDSPDDIGAIMISILEIKSLRHRMLNNLLKVTKLLNDGTCMRKHSPGQQSK